MDRFSIKDIESLTGIKAHTLRIWEQRYGFLKPKRTDTNIRFYDQDDLKFLLNTSFLLNLGHKISEIARLSADEIQTKVYGLSVEEANPDNIQKALSLAMLQLNELAFEKVLMTHVLQNGMENTMIQVVFPFLKSIGFMWQTGTIRPSHEHFITGIIRQKLLVAIDGQSALMDEYSKRYLLFLPEHEFHEIGLLFASYIIRNRGHRVIYLGQNVPFGDLKDFNDTYKPDFVFTAITNPLPNFTLEQFIENLKSDFPESKLYVTGYSVLNSNLKSDTQLRVISDFKEMIRLVSEYN